MRLLFILLFVALSAHGQTFRSYTFLHGLPHNQTRGVRQLPDGRMLVAMEGGFCVYDGAAFRSVPCLLSQTLRTASEVAEARFLTAADGTWWMMRMGRLYHFDPARCRFLYDAAERLRASGVSEPLDNLWPDRDGHLWLLTASQRLYRYDGRHRARLVAHLRGRNERIALVADKPPYYLIYYSTDSLVALDRATLRRRFALRRVLLPEGQTTLSIHNQMTPASYADLDADRLLLSANTRGAQIALLDVRRRTLRQLPSSGYVSAWDVDRRRRRFTVNSFDRLVTYTERGDTTCLPFADKLLDLSRDRDGGLWLATLSSGLRYRAPRPRAVATQPTPSPVTALYVYQGRLLIGTHDGLLGRHDVSGRVHHITEDERHRLWVATDRGIFSPPYIYNKENVASLPDDNISFCLPLAPDSLLICHSLTALGILRPSQHRFIPLPQRPFEAHYITSAVLDRRRRRVVLASQRGMYQLLLPSLTLQPLFPESRYEDYGNKYNCQLLTSRGQWLFGTQQGLIGRACEEGQCIQSLLEARDHTLWVATSSTVVCLDSALTYDYRDGLLPAEHYERAMAQLPDGRIAVGSQAGVSYITPQKAATAARRPVLVGLAICGEEQPLDTLAALRHGLRLRYDENFLTLRFSALRYYDAHCLRYRYRLEGSHQEWQEATSDDGRIEIAYTDLAPGHYTLRVEQSRQACALRIVVRPPLWATWWARALYVLMFVIVIVYCVRLYQTYRRRRMEMLVRVRRLVRRMSHKGKYVRIKDVEVTSRDDALLQRITAAIETNIACDDYGVDQLAADVGIARTHLYRKMQQITGRTPSDFILALRLQRAAQLLHDSDLSVQEVAYQTGFKTPRTFSARFRDRYGCLPKDYRKVTGGAGLQACGAEAEEQ